MALIKLTTKWRIDMEESYECYYCNTELTDVFYANYYSCEHDISNRLCGNGNCWAEWMQENTQEYTIEED